MPHQFFPGEPSDLGCFYLDAIKNNPRLEVQNPKDWVEVNKKIRDLMKLNEIEELKEPALDKPLDSFESPEEGIKNALISLHSSRAEVVRIALKGTKGRYERHIMKAMKQFEYLHKCLVSAIHTLYEEDVAIAKHQKALVAHHIPAKPKSIVSRLKKKLGPKSDNDAVFEALAKDRDEKLVQAAHAMDLMQKHWVLINMAQDNMVWDSEALFRRNGVKVGRLWTNGFEAEHFTKLGNGMWSVQMKWTAVRKSTWRPRTIYVDRRFGRYDKTVIDWVEMEPARIVSGPGDVEFDVDIRVRDELFYEEQDKYRRSFEEELGRV
ncbi:hypothetical protein TARUN_1412 [Trichoderma arundinaceum]|uniref:Uncharacterized protein n=1 Tax=Trichoderma arundinaceum TaxID=490622 RepID=A0A395NXD1_TRIAR|nr:hypothetical protein TARUN_1412 [Trichoderma arundinaceum]